MPTGKAELGLKAPSVPPGADLAAIVWPWLGRLADLLLPPVCIACRRRILSHHGLLCGECFAKIDFIAPPICARLGIPLRRGRPLGGGDRPAASLRPRPGGGALFRHHARAYPKLQMSGSVGGPDVNLPAGGAGQAADLIVPVPLYPSRLWWRRFNQSAMLAIGLGRLAGVPVDCFALRRVRRVRRTTSQVGLSAEQRRRNVAGAFRVDRSAIGRVRGKRVVVVDDVITTGAAADA
jgi:predicted amidophosphoribosyltransferase